ncbi:uncharacterized protein LOC125433613 isoform X1 [Sphaerodactylus townsendi]|uniref:Uncharacterized protein n=1 Tax=Sphaerodactylus townsendi TaxID=933632 RepID=A0ACB8F5A3_9SAUR|nr:uncharacterized protein LOC125433613 isoform X1 [Sphaerodactylus townsendi]XP_048354231.1 uncharacterized protein LOC125433613 isoform X1 [Sphaerodactylus townsendi]
MAKQTYQANLQFLWVSCIVQAVILQTIDTLTLKNVGIPSTVTPYEATNYTISNSSGMPTMSGQEAGNKTTLYNADTNITAIGTTTSFPSSLSPFAQTTNSSHTEASHPSEITAETITEVTDFPTESFISYSTHQTPGKDSEVTTLATAQKESAQPSSTGSLSSSNVLYAVSVSQLSAARAHLKDSEIILTAAFALILTLTILGLLVYILNKHRMQRAQYSHHQLHDTSFDTVDRYATPDDTLVISGGLYDAPRMYNSSMTAHEDEELQAHPFPFSDQPGQFRLEFFGEKGNSISLSYETLQVPPGSL